MLLRDIFVKILKINQNLKFQIYRKNRYNYLQRQIKKNEFVKYLGVFYHTLKK